MDMRETKAGNLSETPRFLVANQEAQVNENGKQNLFYTGLYRTMCRVQI